MKQAAQTSSEQAVTQASNAISNYIGDMQEIMRLIEKNLTKSGGKSDQTLETLCDVRSDLVAVYIYDAKGQLADSYTGTHTMKDHYLKDLSYIALDSYSQGILYLSEPHVESLLQDYYPWVVSVLQELTGADGQRMRVVIDIRLLLYYGQQRRDYLSSTATAIIFRAEKRGNRRTGSEQQRFFRDR